MTVMVTARYKLILSLLLGVLLVLFQSGKVLPYLMPAEQLLFLMGKNFSIFKTLVITQKTRVMNLYDSGEEVLVSEKIWLNNGGFYRSELSGETYGRVGQYNFAHREPGGDMLFRRILMANDSETLMNLLTGMGVDTDTVAFTRHDGVVAYRLGHKNLQRPYLVVDKDSFLPVVFCYTLQTDLEPMVVTVRFGDYQKTGKGWYPYEVIYSAGERLEKSVILDVQVNTPVVQPLSEIMMERAKPGKMDHFQDIPEEDERLKETIELLKEKYQ